MTQQKIIVRGKLDWASIDQAYLINPGDGTRFLSSYIHRHIGKTIVISLEEPEEERDPIANQAFVGVLQNA